LLLANFAIVSATSSSFLKSFETAIGLFKNLIITVENEFDIHMCLSFRSRQYLCCSLSWSLNAYLLKVHFYFGHNVNDHFDDMANTFLAIEFSKFCDYYCYLFLIWNFLIICRYAHKLLEGKIVESNWAGLMILCRAGMNKAQARHLSFGL
jgi:hypothetical protein